MAGQGKLFQFLGPLCSYRNLFACRASVIPYQQNAGLKIGTKEKLKNLDIPEQPKRPLTPYFRFLSEHRSVLQKKHPEWKITEVTKQCAEDWKTVQDTVKEHYRLEYSKELKVFDKKNNEFKASLSPEQVEAIALAKKEKVDNKTKRSLKKRYHETGKPKRPTSSFLYFIKEKWVLPDNKTKNLSEILKQFKDEWNSLPKEKKETYVKMHKDDKERYEKLMEEWELKMIKEGNSDIVRKDSKVFLSRKHTTAAAVTNSTPKPKETA